MQSCCSDAVPGQCEESWDWHNNLVIF